MDGDRIRAARHAREIVADMRLHRMAVPRCYTSMAEEFRNLVRSGAYASWVAASQNGLR